MFDVIAFYRSGAVSLGAVKAGFECFSCIAGVAVAATDAVYGGRCILFA